MPKHARVLPDCGCLGTKESLGGRDAPIPERTVRGSESTIKRDLNLSTRGAAAPHRASPPSSNSASTHRASSRPGRESSAPPNTHCLGPDDGCAGGLGTDHASDDPLSVAVALSLPPHPRRRVWAFGRFYATESARRNALPARLHEYNHHRPHTSIEKRLPSAGQPTFLGSTAGRCPVLHSQP